MNAPNTNSAAGPADIRQPAITPPVRFRRQLLVHAQRAMYWSAMGFAYRALAKPRGAVILMYHSIADAQTAPYVDHRLRIGPDTFDWQMRFLARHRRVISLTALVDAIANKQPIAPGTVVITFDDGYLDNLTVAAPILARYDLPATLYLPTAYIRHAQTQWVDQLYTMFVARTRNTYAPTDQRTLDINDDADCREAYSLLCERLITAPLAERNAILDDVASQLEPAAAPPTLTMNWDQVQQLIRQYPKFELGVHTVDHVDMTTLDSAQATAQLADSMAELRSEVGVDATHFSYPYGRHTAHTRPVVAASGLRSAVAAGTDYLIDARSDVFALARIDAPRCRTLLRFQTSGAYPGLPRKVLGRA